MPDVASVASGGIEWRGYRRGATTADDTDQYVIPTKDRIESYVGRASTFRIPGSAAGTSQNLFSIFNAVGSSVIVEVETVTYDVAQTAARVVEPPMLRIHRITTAPTGGTALSKVPVDTTLTSSSSVTLLQGASAERTASAITATPAAGNVLTQEVVPRALTLVGYEQFDRAEFFSDQRPVILRAGQGLLVALDYSATTSNPNTDMHTGNIRWCEYTRP